MCEGPQRSVWRSCRGWVAQLEDKENGNLWLLPFLQAWQNFKSFREPELGSFDKIWLKTFYEGWPSLQCHMLTSEQTEEENACGFKMQSEKWAYCFISVISLQPATWLHWVQILLQDVLEEDNRFVELSENTDKERGCSS